MSRKKTSRNNAAIKAVAGVDTSGLPNLNWGYRESLQGYMRTVPGSHSRPGAPDAMIFMASALPAGGDAFWESIQMLMNKLRAASGSNITYTNKDLARYILNAREMIKEMAISNRGVASLRMVNLYDADTPVKYAAMGLGITIGIDKIGDFLAQDIAEYSRIAQIIPSFAPLHLPLFDRTWALYANIYADSPTEKFSAKVITSNEFRIAVENANGDIELQPYAAYRCKCQVGSDPAAGTGYPVDPIGQRLRNARMIMNEIMNDIQMSRIAGDMLKAFGPAALWHLPDINENSVMKVVYDEGVLTQIKNMAFVGRGATALSDINRRIGSNLIKPDTSNTLLTIVTRPGFTQIISVDASKDRNGTAITASSDEQAFGTPKNDPLLISQDIDLIDEASPKMITTVKSHVTAVDAMVYTRMIPKIASATTGRPLTACGTEIPLDYVWVYGEDLGSIKKAPGDTSYADNTQYVAAQIPVASFYTRGLVGHYDVALLWSRDDWAPETHTDECPNAVTGQIRSLFDIDNWAYVRNEDLVNFHAIAMLGLLATPTRLVEQSEFRFPN